MTQDVANLPDISTAKLPATYEAAKTALAECSRIDECQQWADKAEALASYAKQSKDDQLRKMADRIQARAIRRCGELLKQIEPSKGGRPSAETRDGAVPSLTARQQERIDHTLWQLREGQITRNDANARIAEIDPHWAQRSRQNAATHAGMSERQRKTALRVANVPDDEFNGAVESDAPPTVTKLAEQGKQKLVDIGDSSPVDFAAATRALAQLKRFAEFAESHDPEDIAAGVRPSEFAKTRDYVRVIDAWLDRFITRIGD